MKKAPGTIPSATSLDSAVLEIWSAEQLGELPAVLRNNNLYTNVVDTLARLVDADILTQTVSVRYVQCGSKIL